LGLGTNHSQYREAKRYGHGETREDEVGLRRRIGGEGYNIGGRAQKGGGGSPRLGKKPARLKSLVVEDSSSFNKNNNSRLGERQIWIRGESKKG